MLGTWIEKSHLPSSPASLAASAAIVRTEAGSPSRSASLSMISLNALVSARTFSPNFTLSRESSWLILPEKGLALLVEQGAAANEPAVGVLEEKELLAVELQGGAGVIDGLDPQEELLVEADVVLVGGQHGGRRPGQGLKLLVRVRAQEASEDGGHLGQQDAGMIERGDGVGERGRLGVVGDGRDLGLFAPDALFDGRQEMLVPDAVEGRDVERRPVGLEKRIVGFGGRSRGKGRDRGCEAPTHQDQDDEILAHDRLHLHGRIAKGLLYTRKIFLDK